MIHIIHHMDQDGYASAAIVQHYLDKEGVKSVATFHGVTYGDSVPEGIDYEKDLVFIVDFAFQEKGVMLDLYKKSKGSLTWIDHHQASIDLSVEVPELQGVRGVRQIGEANGDLLSGCELAWRYFFPDTPQPVILDWIGDWDTWRHTKKGNTLDAWAMNSYMYDQKLFPGKKYDWWKLMFTEYAEQAGTWDIYSLMLPKGHLLIGPERRRNRGRYYNEGFEAILVDGDREYKVLAINDKGGSITAIDWYKPERHDIVMMFYHTGMNQLNVRLYSESSDTVDCNQICHSLGHAGPIPSGGGHRGAGGFQTKWEHFYTLIRNPVTLKSISEKKRAAKNKK